MIEQELQLDISTALSSIDQIGAALDQVAISFKVALADALQALGSEPVTLADPDTTAITSSIDSAVADADTTVLVDADTSAIPDEVAKVESDVDPLALPVDLDDDDAIIALNALDSTELDAIELPIDFDGEDAIGRIDGFFDTNPLDPVELQLDESAALSELDSFGDNAPPVDISVDADTSQAESAISDLESLEPTVSVEADTSNAESQVSDFVSEAESEEIDIPVNVDSSSIDAANDSLTNLGGTASKTADEATGAAEGIGAIGIATTALKASTAGATGEIGGLSSGLGSLTGTTAGVVGGVTAAAATFGVFVAAGEKMEAGIERVDLVFGRFAENVNHINIGGLNGDLADLAIKAGSSAANLRQASASLGQVEIAAGKTQEQASKAVGVFQALALRAVALNPALGDAGDVMNRLIIALSRGGRFAAAFGISLAPGAIAAKALADTGKDAASQLTIMEKAEAGAALAAKQLGDNLGKDFNKGIQQTAVQFKAVEAQIKATVAQLGQPLVKPILEATKAFTPFAQALAKIVGSLLQGLIPAVRAASTTLTLLAPIFSGIASAISFIAPVLTPLITGLLTFKALQLGLAAANKIFGLSARAAAIDYAGFGATVETTNAEIAASTAALDLNPIFAIVSIAAAAASALGLFGGEADDSAAQVDSFTQAVEEANGALDKNAEKAAASLLKQRHQVDDLAKSGIKLNDVFKAITHASDDGIHALKVLGETGLADSVALQKTGKTVDDLIKSLLKSDPALANIILKLQRHGQLNAGNVKTLADLAENYKKAGKAAKDDAATGVDKVTNSLTDSSQAADDAQKAIEDWEKSAVDAAGSTEDAFNAASKGLDDFVGQIPDAKKAFDDVSDAADKFGVKLTGPILAKGLGDQIASVQTFTRNLRTIVEAGLTDLAQVLAEEGPEKAGGLAQQLAFQLAQGNPLVAAELNNLVQTLNKGQEDLKNALSPEALEQTLAKQLTDITNFTHNLGVILGAGFTNVAAIIAQKGPAEAGGLAQTLADQIAAGQPAVAQQLNITAQQLITAQQTYAGLITNWGPALQQAATGAFAVVSTSAQASLNAVPPAIDGVSPDVLARMQGLSVAVNQQWGGGILTQIPQAAADAVAGAGQAITDGTSQVTSPAGTAGTGTATSFGQNLGPNMQSAVTNAIALAGNTFSAQTRFVLNAAAQGAGFGVGVNFYAGMVSGIRTGKGAVASAAASLVTAAKDAANAKAKAKSPSQVFYEIGTNLTKGLALGIADVRAVEQVQKAQADVIKAAASAINLPPVQINPAAGTVSKNVTTAQAGVTAAAQVAPGVTIENLHVHPPFPDPVQAGIETGKQLQATMFRLGK